MKKILKNIRNKKGETETDSVVHLIVFCFSLILIMQILGSINQKRELDNIAIEMARYVQVNGQVTDNVDVYFKALTSSFKIPPTIEWKMDYLDEDVKTVQLGTIITCYVKGKISIFGFNNQNAITIPAIGKGVSVCEKFWK